MKHLLNNLSEEEKNSIREQHTGKMKIVTENFKKLLNSKLGDSKPLVSEQPIIAIDNPQSNQSTKPIKKSSSTSTPTQSKGSPTPTQSKSTPSTTSSYVGKTVNLYYDVENKELWSSSLKITSFDIIGGAPTIKFDKTPNLTYTFSCVTNSFNSSDRKTVLYNKPFSDELNKKYCTKSSGGQTVPKADFASTTPQSDNSVA